MAEFNLFDHHHSHGHDHDHSHGHDAPELDALDPAQKSMADALRVTFLILKIIMAALVIWYIFISGCFTVYSGQVGVRLWFGRIEGMEGERTLPPNFYLALPYPFQEHILIPTSTVDVKLDKEFWYLPTKPEIDNRSTPAQSAGSHPKLNPEIDGSLLTGDANIIHAKWTIRYSVKDAEKYLMNVGDFKKADEMVRAAAQEGVIFAVAQKKADDLVTGIKSDDIRTATDFTQKSLDSMNTGLVIQALLADQTIMPLPVIEAFNAVSGAQADRRNRVAAAEQERAKTLGEAAGEAYDGLLTLINAYENADARKQEDVKAELDKKLDAAFHDMVIEDKGVRRRVGGEAAKVIFDAKTYRSRIVNQLASEASRFSQLLPQYELRPRIVLDRLWADAREEIFSGDVETFYLPSSSQVYLDLNRDPVVENQRNADRLQTEKAREMEAGNAPRRRITLTLGRAACVLPLGLFARAIARRTRP